MVTTSTKTPPRKQVASGDRSSLLTLVSWAVFALAAWLKFWRITSVFRRRTLRTVSSTDQFRQTLERIWTQDAQRR